MEKKFKPISIIIFLNVKTGVVVNMSWLLERDNPPHLTLKKRQGTRSVAEIRRASPRIAGGDKASTGAKRDAALGLMLLWHDQWNEAHTIAQAHEGESEFDLLHTIGHRREGDYSNARYWVEETGKIPVFNLLAPRIEPILEGGDALRDLILPGGAWNARGFVDAVERHPEHAMLRRIQAEEFLVFFEYLLNP